MKKIIEESCCALVKLKGLKTNKTNGVDIKPMFRNGFGIKEKSSAVIGLGQEVFGKVCNVSEEGVTGTGFQYE